MELYTNDSVSEAYKEAAEYAREEYPEGTIIVVRFRENWREDRCEIRGEHNGSFRVRSLITGKTHNFYPGIQPHAIVDTDTECEVRG